MGLEQQPHRIALGPEGGLHADEDIAEFNAVNMDRAAIGLVLAGCGAPLRFDLRKMRLGADMLVGGNARGDIGIGAEPLGIALEHGIPQRFDALGHVDRVAFASKADERGVERFEDGEMRGGAGRARIGREVEDDDGELALAPLGLAQGHQPRGLRGKRPGPLGMAAHRPHRSVGIVAPPAEEARRDGSIQFGDRDHHRGLDRQQAEPALAPAFERLELDRMGGDIGQVEARERLNRRVGVVVGRPTDEREAGQVDDRIDRRLAVLHEERLDCGPCVEPSGKGRHHFEARRFHAGDHTIVMRGVSAQQVGAQHQQADPALRALDLRQSRELFGQRSFCARVVDPDFGIVLRRLGRRMAPPRFALASGVAVDQRARHRDHIVVRSGEPVLQGEKIGAHVLRGAGDEFQDLG